MKRTVKFKDGTRAQFEAKDKPQVTIFKCDRCAQFLTDFETMHGFTCSKCLAAEKQGKEAERMKEISKIVNARHYMKDIHSLPHDITLEISEVNYLGELYEYKVIQRAEYPGLFAIEIREQEDKGLLYSSFSANGNTQEGKDVYNYLIINKLIPQKNLL